MKTTQSFFTLALIVAAALALPVTTPANTYHGHHHGMFKMLSTLDLNQQQQAQIKTLIGNYKATHPEGSQPDPAARRQLRDQILAVLTPAQRTKLDAEMRTWRSQHPESRSPAPTK